jgi:serine/threonine-protein kinase
VGRHRAINTNNVLGLFLLALCTAVFYAFVMWTVYLALEVYVRRHWPSALISWSRMLAGQWRDPIVGRDVLIGAALGISWTLAGRFADLTGNVSNDPDPTWTDTRLLPGAGEALGAWLSRGPLRVRDGLAYFFVLFLLRLVFRRKPWIAGVVFTALLTVPIILGNDEFWVALLVGGSVYALSAVVMFRFGLLPIVAASCLAGLLGPPVTLHTGAWYFAGINLLFGSAVVVILWAYITATGGLRAWSARLMPN